MDHKFFYEEAILYYNVINPVWQPIDDEPYVEEETKQPEYEEVDFTDDEIPFGGGK